MTDEAIFMKVTIEKIILYCKLLNNENEESLIDTNLFLETLTKPLEEYVPIFLHYRP